ncbi:MAG: diacylglycerol kinase family protein [Bacillaceae bacterium]
MNNNYRQPLQKSFLLAFLGIVHCFKNERNFRIHVGIGAFVILFGMYVSLAMWEWCVILITIGIVLSLECLNTAIETVVDLVTDTYHPYAKIAKDVGAGAVLTFSILAVIIGLLIFVPKVVVLFSRLIL